MIQLPEPYRSPFHSRAASRPLACDKAGPASPRHDEEPPALVGGWLLVECGRPRWGQAACGARTVILGESHRASRRVRPFSSVTGTQWHTSPSDVPVVIVWS